MAIFNKKDYLYTSLFCEENIWKLAHALYTNQQAKPIDVLFILNKTNTVSLCHQTQSYINEPIIWDYHVILSAQIKTEILIFDFDSRCAFPARIDEYFAKTFHSHYNLMDKLIDNYKAFIKPIPYEYYLKHFFSDRQHMLGIIEPCNFPNYNIIKPNENIEPLTLKQCRGIKHRTDDRGVISPKEYLLDLNNT